MNEFKDFIDAICPHCNSKMPGQYRPDTYIFCIQCRKDFKVEKQGENKNGLES